MAENEGFPGFPMAEAPTGFEFGRCLLVDLDGTVRQSKSGKDFIGGPEDIEIRPGVSQKLWRYRQEGWTIIAVTNQGGVAFGLKTHEQTEAEFLETNRLLKGVFDYAFASPFHPQGIREPFCHKSLTRKPFYGMLVMAEMTCWSNGLLVDWDNSLFVGDRQEDRDCAEAAGVSFLHESEFFGRQDDDYRVGDYLETCEGMVYRIKDLEGDAFVVVPVSGPVQFESAIGLDFTMFRVDADRHKLHRKEEWQGDGACEQDG